MAGKICSMFGCNNYNVANCSKSFFRFPKDPNQCKQWVLMSRRADLDVILKKSGPGGLYTRVICSDHFKKEDFRNRNLPSQGLLRGVVPTQNLPASKSNTNQRKSPKKRQLHSCPTVDEPCELKDLSLESEILPDARIPKRRRTNVDLEIKSLQQKLRRAQKTVCRQRRLIRTIREEKFALEEQVSSSRVENLKKCFGENCFLLSLLLNKTKKGRSRRYTEFDRTFASAVYYCSPKAYKFLQNFFGLPTVRSLRLWLQDLSVTPGINPNILKLLKLKMSQLPVEDRVVSLVFDEMSLKENITYNSSSDVFEGYPDLGMDVRHCDSTIDPQLSFANQATVLMLRGLQINFKQILGYYLTSGSMASETLKEVIQLAVRKLQEIGVVVKAVVCDQGPNNLKLHRILGVSPDNPYIVSNGEKIYVFFDAPHLLKSVRNNFKKFDALYNGKVASFKHIVEFYEKDKVMNPRLAPKLTTKHIELPPFTPMRVRLATQLFSHSVSRGILTHVALNSMVSTSVFTAEFISDFDSLFDVFNSAQKCDAKLFRRAVSNNSSHWKFLEEIEAKLHKLTFINSKRSVPPCVKGWILNISSIKQLWDELHNRFNFKFLLTRRLTQDCLENMFSVIRSKGFHNVTPDCSKFRSAIRSVMCNQLLMPSPDGNCELDFSKCVLLKSDFKKHCAGIALTSPVKIEICDGSEEAEGGIDILQKNSVAYVSGWVCSRLKHDICKNHLSSLEESFSASNIHISMKKYDNTNFLHPTSHASILSNKIHSLFKSKFTTFLNESRSGVKSKLKEMLQVDPDCPVCLDCINIYSDKFFNVLIKCFLKTTNDSATRSLQKKENRKAKKIMHK